MVLVPSLNTGGCAGAFSAKTDTARAARQANRKNSQTWSSMAGMRFVKLPQQSELARQRR